MILPLILILSVLVLAYSWYFWGDKIKAFFAGLKKPKQYYPRHEPVMPPFAPPQDPVPKPADFWVVRWYGRTGDFHSDLRVEMAIFTSQEDAVRFKGRLEDAFRLIRHTSATQVSLKKGEQP